MQVKELRVAKGWSQEQLSEFSGLNVRTIQRIEKGHKASPESLKALAAVFELEMQQWGEAEKQAQLRQQVLQQQRADEYVQSLKGFYVHIGVYVITNIFLFCLNLILTPHEWWFQYALFCWIVGLAIHAFTVFNRFGHTWEQRQRERFLRKEQEMWGKDD